MKKIALVTGGNRGIGHEVCRQLAALDYEVVLAARDERKGRDAAGELGVGFLTLDVTSEESVERAFRDFTGKHPRLDVLVNNAGILPGREGTALEATMDDIRRTMETNCFGAFLVARRFLPLMRKQRYGRIVNVSSGMGQLSEMAGGYVGYRLSKTALNAVTRILATEVSGDNVLVNSACPGWVHTDMGGKEAPRTPAEGADTIVWLATLPDDGPTGGFFRNRKVLAW